MRATGSPWPRWARRGVEAVVYLGLLAGLDAGFNDGRLLAVLGPEARHGLAVVLAGLDQAWSLLATSAVAASSP